MNVHNIGAVVTDLDGTLLTDDKRVQKRDYDAFVKLGELGIKRIAATGRNLKISRDVLHDDFPLDYLIFSTGSGIYDWQNKEIIRAEGLEWKHTDGVIQRFMKEGFDFTIHQPIPNNYMFYYHVKDTEHSHLYEYVNHYPDFGEPFHESKLPIDNACQLLAIIETDTVKYAQLVEELEDVKLVRTTSPLKGEAMWIEVFPKHVSKAWGLNYIHEQYGIPLERMLGIGNDYNDIDFLEAVGHPRVVSNAHPDLLEIFPVVKSNEDCGVADAIESLIKLT
jgi:Cof subfamily protein (haloacid dehalogenase superfamily)